MVGGAELRRGVERFQACPRGAQRRGRAHGWWRPLLDPLAHRPVAADARFTCSLGYMGTYPADRQPRLDGLFIQTARARPNERFVLAGPQYPVMNLPRNMHHQSHLYPRDHAAFYSSNAATLSRDAMRRSGWSPASRLLEATACDACSISDTWPGLESVLEPGREVLLAETQADVAAQLNLSPGRRQAIGAAARACVLREHTFANRAEQVDAAISHSMTALHRL